MSGIFGYFTRKNYNHTPSVQKKEEQESSNIFDLKKNIEY